MALKGWRYAVRGERTAIPTCLLNTNPTPPEERTVVPQPSTTPWYRTLVPHLSSTTLVQEYAYWLGVLLLLD